jgi:chemotaxis regulatin CheY-phosphate phosphatase CheZ
LEPDILHDDPLACVKDLRELLSDLAETAGDLRLYLAEICLKYDLKDAPIAVMSNRVADVLKRIPLGYRKSLKR